MVAVSNKEKEIALEGLDENLIFEYDFVTANQQNVASSSINHFNTFAESIFKNNSGKGKEEAMEISWAIPNDKINQILSIYPNATYTIKYNTKIGAKPK